MSRYKILLVCIFDTLFTKIVVFMYKKRLNELATPMDGQTKQFRWFLFCGEQRWNKKRRPRGRMAPICLEVESNRGNPLFGHKKAKQTFRQHMKPFHSRLRRFHIITSTEAQKTFAKILRVLTHASKLPPLPQTFECCQKLFSVSSHIDTQLFRSYLHRRWQKAVGW